MKRNGHNKIATSMILFHWITGLGMILVLMLGLIMDDKPDRVLFNAHVSFGLLLAALSIPRLIARLVGGLPKPVSERGRFEAVAAKVVMYSLLALTLILPLSGIALTLSEGNSISLFGLELFSPVKEMGWLEKLAEGIHEFAGETLLPLLLMLHVTASMLHHFVKKDATLLRMLGRT